MFVCPLSGEGEKGRGGESEDRVSAQGKPAAKSATDRIYHLLQDQEKVRGRDDPPPSRSMEREREGRGREKKGRGREGPPPL